VVTSTSGITGSGTLNTIAMFKPDGQTIGDSWLTQERIPGIAINYINFDGPSGFQNRLTLINGYIETNDLQVTNITAGDTGNIDFQGNTTLGNSTSDFIWHRGTTYLTGPVLDTSNTAGTTGQVLVSNASSQLEWTDIADIAGSVTGSGTTNTIPIWTDGPNSVLGNSLITQAALGQGINVNTNLEVTDDFTVTGSIQCNSDLTVEGTAIFNGQLDINGTVRDANNDLGTDGQLLVSNASSQLEWKSYSESGATFLGWARYDGTPSFSTGTEVTVLDGNYIDPPVSLVTNQVIDPYTNGASGKFVFTNNDLNAVYSLTVVFKASAANANQTHIDIDFISGATDYERLSKSIGFYKGNDVVDNFHEMFQFYVDSDLITFGLQPRLYAQGGDVKFGDVIFFIQKQQQPAI
jgi:hypothetical protein